uniref:Uncharacterized protein n=1 Tax=Anguilla anguilla TaxID=7936 RepID=A0A0E9P9C7_ANGAN
MLELDYFGVHTFVAGFIQSDRFISILNLAHLTPLISTSTRPPAAE